MNGVAALLNHSIFHVSNGDRVRLFSLLAATIHPVAWLTIGAWEQIG